MANYISDLDYFKIYINYLNRDEEKPLGHEVTHLVFNEQGRREPIVLCACGAYHPTGGIDFEFVCWD